MLKVEPDVTCGSTIVRREGGLTMCLGIPGQVVELLDEHEHLARVDVSGVGRIINIGLLEDERIAPGDWVLIHVGLRDVEDRRGRGPRSRWPRCR